MLAYIPYMDPMGHSYLMGSSWNFNGINHDKPAKKPSGKHTKKLLNMAIEIVHLPMKNDGIP